MQTPTAMTVMSAGAVSALAPSVVPPPHGGPGPFGAFLATARPSAPLVRRATLGLSVVLHAAVVAAWIAHAISQVDEISPPRIAVSFLTLPAAAPPPPPPPPRRAAASSRPRVTPRREILQPTEIVMPVEPAEPSTPDGAQDETDGATGGVPLGVAGGITGSMTVAAVTTPPPRLPPPPPSGEQRRALLARYLQQIFRTRIAERFRYPRTAEALEVEGLVVVRASIDTRGYLAEARIAGACPHDILCEDALRTIRASAPFPPPPVELGTHIQVDVPLGYRLP